MGEVKQNPEIGYFKCPVCNVDKFNSLQEMLSHMDKHNAKDPEIHKSIVAEREEFINRMF